MPDDALRVVTQLMPSAGGGEDIGDLEVVVSRPVSVVYPRSVIPALVEKFEDEGSLQVWLNQNVAAVRTEFDAVKSLDELGLLPRTQSGSAVRHINSEELLSLRHPTIQKAYENMFRSSLNLVAISEVFRKRTGEALPIALEDWSG
jgi:hypothetical protein